MKSDDCWTDQEDIVVPHQSAIQVYMNPRGEIVIRQQGDYGEDSCIALHPSYAEALCDAIMRHAVTEQRHTNNTPESSRSKAAERQRRYRERQKQQAESEATNDAPGHSSSPK